MGTKATSPKQSVTTIPPDDPQRRLVIAQSDGKFPRIGIAGDTYTILLTGQDTAGHFCLIDMHAHFDKNSGLFVPRMVRASLRKQPKTLRFIEDRFGVNLFRLADDQ